KPLSELVMRCLEKNPGARIQDYATLQELLSPFSSLHPKAAPLGLRLASGVFDYFLLSLILFAGSVTTSIRRRSLWDLLGSSRSYFPWLDAAEYLLPFTYYTVTEGLWGATLGKAICRIRVCGVDSSVAGIRRTFLRTFVFTVPILLQFLFARNAPGWASVAY